ncbi:Protein of unknown function [Friedmanniella luteola]|uniref:DUF2530 domain-containing protein n=1 Tax=Friedmanniella luteola TaxID=546871 RepID=A0A1H1MD98_9ACTN|nr:DUF2530 domain-containing protein [Friedmanniella luteola]SDR84773.1 Protein of unknown function [Friedmanniella luteola]
MTPPTSSSPAGRPEHHHRLVQAPVPAVDVDGLRVVAVGTVLFAVAAVLTGLRRDQLVAAGHEDWFGVCVSGAGLGLLGLLYCWNRVRQRRSAPATPNR